MIFLRVLITTNNIKVLIINYEPKVPITTPLYMGRNALNA
jgi:hypothetical protein